jgi:hypothetical protein
MSPSIAKARQIKVINQQSMYVCDQDRAPCLDGVRKLMEYDFNYHLSYVSCF